MRVVVGVEGDVLDLLAYQVDTIVQFAPSSVDLISPKAPPASDSAVA